jgi:translation initiation factor IF-2
VVARAAPGARAETSGEESGPFMMPLIIRADAHGSLEAIEHEVAKLGDEHARVVIVQSGVGNVSENDVKAALAGTAAASIIGFNVGVDPIAETLARERGVHIETFDIIYKLTEKLEELLRGAAPKRAVEEIVGRAKVLKQFSNRKEEHVVGGKVSEGHLAKRASVRVVRRGTVIGIGKIKNIQTNKQNVDRVEHESEFGAQITAPFEIAQGDTLECFTTTMQ